MAMRIPMFKPRAVVLSNPLFFFFNLPFTSFSPTNHSDPPLQQLVNEISRILSDHRSPNHDLELSLKHFPPKVSTSLVEQVLKRCKNIVFSAHSFFLWTRRIPGFKPSEISYRIMIDILGSNKQFALLWDFLIEMRDTGSCEISPELFWIVFKAYGRANLPADAVRAFSRMVEFGIKPSVHDLDKLLFFLCKRKHVSIAQQFFDKVKAGFDPNPKTYSILIRGWGDIGNPEEARKVFDEMHERGCVADLPAHNSFLEALCKGGNVDEAYELSREMRSSSNGVQPDACTFSIFIRAYCESNDLHSVFRVLDRMKRYDLSPNVFTYNCVIKRLCKNDKVEEAYQLLEEIIERGVKPDNWSYNTILAYHCEHSEVHRALRMIMKMEKEDCLPDQHAYNMLLKLLIRVGRFDRVEEVWNSMERRGYYPCVSTYAVMIHGLCKKRGKLEEACKYFEMMVEEGLPPYGSTVELLRNRLLGLGLMDQIEILGEKMRQSSSCSIQEMGSVMNGNKVNGGRKRREDIDPESD